MCIDGEEGFGVDAQLRGMERIIDRVGYCGQWVKSVDICQCAPGSAFEIGRAHLPPVGGNVAEPLILPGKETH